MFSHRVPSQQEYMSMNVFQDVLVFEKPPFGRKPREGRKPTISKDEFLQFTKSVWEFAPQSARLAGHPAPFPLELPRRAIELYTFSSEIVLDPFIGTGSTAIAAKNANRHYVGYEVSSEYVELARQRLTVHPTSKNSSHHPSQSYDTNTDRSSWRGTRIDRFNGAPWSRGLRLVASQQFP